MRLPFLLVAIFSTLVVADSPWGWSQEDGAIDNLEDPYPYSTPESLLAQSDSFPIPDHVASIDLALKKTSVFVPDCKGFEYTLCCTGVQTDDWDEMNGKFFSITDCKKCVSVPMYLTFFRNE